MTVNVAVWFNDTVLLLSDLGVTTEDGSGTVWSAGPFGQRQTNDRGETVRADAAKIARIGTHAAAAVCGELRPARRFLRSMQEDVQDAVPIRRAIRRAHSYAVESEGDFACLVAALEGADVVLFLSTESSVIQELNRGSTVCPMTPGACVLGSLTEPNRGFIVSYVKNALSQKKPVDPETRLAKVLACANVACVQLDLVAENVSGPIFGIRVDSTGASWQADMVYIPWSVADLGSTSNAEGSAAAKVGTFPMVACYVRDDVLCVKSMINEVREYFPPEMALEDPWPARDEWHAAHDEELLTAETWTKAKYYAFLPSVAGCIVAGQLAPGDVYRRGGATEVTPRLRQQMEAAVESRLRFIGGEFPEHEAHTFTWLTERPATAGTMPFELSVRPRRPDPRAPCPCGSGKSHRRCHGQGQ